MPQKLKLAVTILAALIAAYLLYYAVRNFYLSDEDRVANRIGQAISAAMNNDTKGVVSVIAPEFISEDGLNKGDFQMFIFAQFRAYSGIKIQTLEQKIELDKKNGTALVAYKGRLTATENGSKQTMGDTLSFKLHFKKYDDGGWLINKMEEVKEVKK